MTKARNRVASRRQPAGRPSGKKASAVTAYDRRGSLAAVLVLLSPAVIIPFALDRFVFGKLLVAALGLALVWLSPSTGRLDRVCRILLCGVALSLVVATLASGSPWTAFWGRAPRYEGLLTLLVYLACVPAGARALGPAAHRRTLDRALATVTVVVLVITVLAVLESLGARPLSTNLDRPGSLLGNASDEGALSVLYCGPLLVFALQQRSVVRTTAAAAGVLCVVLSASRGALVGLVVVLVVLACVSSRQRRRLTAAVGAGAVVVALSVPDVRDRILGQSPFAVHTVTGRGQLWSESLRLVGSHWLFGVGPDQFAAAIIGYHDRSWYADVGPAMPPDSPHNWILQALVTGGVCTALLVLALIGRGAVIVRHAVRAEGRDDIRRQWVAGSVAGLVGYATALLFHLTSAGTTVPAAFLAGSAIATGFAARAGSVRLLRTLPSVAVICALGVALVYAAAVAGEVAMRSAIVDADAGRLTSADRDFRVARSLRPWDVDVPVAALHVFAILATSGAPAANTARHWWNVAGDGRRDEAAVLDYAAVLEAGGDVTDATSRLTSLLRADPDNPLLHLRRGILHAERHDYDLAIRDFRAATTEAPTSPEPWLNLARAYTLVHDTVRAKESLAHARQLQR